MATPTKAAKKSSGKKSVKVGDMKPRKDAQGGRRNSSAGRASSLLNRNYVPKTQVPYNEN